MRRADRRTVVLAAAVALAASAEAQARSLPIVVKGGEVRQVGPLHVPATKNLTLAQVRRTLGRPTSTEAEAGQTGSNGDPDLCFVRWKALGLRATFGDGSASGSESPRVICSPRTPLDLLQLRSRRYRLPSGLRVGDGLARLRRLHPRAKLDGDTVDLVGGFTSSGDHVYVLIKRRKVAEIVLHLG
jgi:hypothetical protein